VTDAERILGFNPYKVLVDFIADQISDLSSRQEAGPVAVQKKT
jgi:hypothetical protein